MSRFLLVLAFVVATSGAARAANTFEFRIGGALATVLASPGNGGGGTALPMGYGLGLRLASGWRIGVAGGMGLFGFHAEGQVDHAPWGFASNGPLLRFGAGGLVTSVRCDARCDTLHADEIPFGAGPHLAFGGGWRWSFDDDEGGLSVGVSVVGAWLESRRSGVSRGYVGGTGPWVELDW